jgi:hypothetical protein
MTPTVDEYLKGVPSYPKIFHVGSNYIPDLFTGDVEITEKIDGSMFAFGINSNREIVMRSKGVQIFAGSKEKMFDKAIDHVYSKGVVKALQDMPPDTYFYGEYLRSPKHNTLAYETVPVNNILIFGVRKRGPNYTDWFIDDYDKMYEWAQKVGLQCVPLLYKGPVTEYTKLEEFFPRISVLGNETLEGVVVKNYAKPSLVGNMEQPSFGKLVREDFKERNSKEWKADSAPSKLEAFIDSFRTEARWNKAIQHLRDDGKLTNEPKDIGPLIAEIKKDLAEEEAETIKQGLYRLFMEQIARHATGGFPEFYKEYLGKGAFKNE